MTAEEIGNIIFNETRSLSGKGISEARAAIAHAVRNGEEKYGANRPTTVPSDIDNVPSAEAGTYRASEDAAGSADSERAQGDDPTQGATHFNMTEGISTKPFYGAHRRSYGPFHNSYPNTQVPVRDNVYINFFE